MARLSIGDKARRVLTFLHGLTNPRAASVLAAFGFSQRDLDEGWQLLRELRSVRLGERAQLISPRTLRDLDEWENRWLAVSKASLERHYPDVHATVFLNLSQTSGLDVINSVGTFLERIKELEAARDADSKAARKLLNDRGLNKATLDEARALLADLGTIRAAPEPSDSAEEIATREQALWSWYKEWSAIAQTNISDRTVLRGLGFLRSTRRADPEEMEDELEEDDSPSSTADQPAVAV